MIKIRCCTVLWIQSVPARSVDTDQQTSARNGVEQMLTENKPRPVLHIFSFHLAAFQRAEQTDDIDWWIDASVSCKLNMGVRLVDAGLC